MNIVQTDSGGFATDDGVSGARNGISQTLIGSVARTDTTAKILGYLPANAVITSIVLKNVAVSDASSTAVLSVGNASSATAYLNTADVKGGALGQLIPTTKATLGTVGTSAITVKGLYAETGTASSTGGPWGVYITYAVPV